MLWLNLGMTHAVHNKKFHGKVTAKNENVAMWAPKKQQNWFYSGRWHHPTEVLKSGKTEVFVLAIVKIKMVN